MKYQSRKHEVTGNFSGTGGWQEEHEKYWTIPMDGTWAQH